MADEQPKPTESVPAAPTAEGSAESIVSKAEKAAQDLKAENDRLEKLLKQNQEVAAKIALGGRSFAGQPPLPEKTPDEQRKDKINAALARAGSRERI